MSCDWEMFRLAKNGSSNLFWSNHIFCILIMGRLTSSDVKYNDTCTLCCGNVFGILNDQGRSHCGRMWHHNKLSLLILITLPIRMDYILHGVIDLPQIQSLVNGWTIMVSKRKEMIDNDIQYPNGTSGQTTRANNSKSITQEEHTLQ